jgi:hypothetical protein
LVVEVKYRVSALVPKGSAMEKKRKWKKAEVVLIHRKSQEVMRSKPERSEMLKTSDFPVVRVAEKYLLNHIDIIIGSGCAGGRSSLLGDILSGRSRFTTVVRTTPVIFHLLVQLLLGLARTGIGSAVGSISLLRAVVASTPATAAAVRGALVGALSGHITVDVVWGGLGDVAAMRTATATTASAICVVLGAHAAVVTGALNAVQEAGPMALCRV